MMMAFGSPVIAIKFYSITLSSHSCVCVWVFATNRLRIIHLTEYEYVVKERRETDEYFRRCTFHHPRVLQIFTAWDFPGWAGIIQPDRPHLLASFNEMLVLFDWNDWLAIYLVIIMWNIWNWWCGFFSSFNKKYVWMERCSWNNVVVSKNRSIVVFGGRRLSYCSQIRYAFVSGLVISNYNVTFDDHKPVFIILMILIFKQHICDYHNFVTNAFLFSPTILLLRIEWKSSLKYQERNTCCDQQPNNYSVRSYRTVYCLLIDCCRKVYPFSSQCQTMGHTKPSNWSDSR